MLPLANRISFLLPFVAVLSVAAPAVPQQNVTPPEDSFSLDAAILDTSIPFAVGAHEARQELRGAFGWPTFQEGLVQGVYFRFDPDGYARFSPTPRLDTDVFEVICRPRTHICMARKDSLSVTLNNRSQIELQLENVTEADEFLIAEGISELPLPNNILQPLDARMELLLSSGGDLVVSRARNEVDRISLKGFAAVTSYLRWVAAEQSYTVLPRDWPVPNSGSATAEITRPANWTSPMPKPIAADTSGPDAEVAEVRGELRILRELLLNGDQNANVHDTQQTERLLELQSALDMLATEIAGLKSSAASEESNQLLENADRYWPSTHSQPLSLPQDPMENDAQRMARRMEYLMTEIGLEPEVALMLLQDGETQASVTNENDGNAASVVDNLLNELRASLPKEPLEDITEPTVTQDEYLLLTDYFKTVFPNK